MNPIPMIEAAIKGLQQYNNINCGGCCVVAAALAKELKAYVPMSIIVVNDKKHVNLTTIRRKVKNNTVNEWEHNGAEFNHVLVQFTYKGITYYVDSNGIITDLHDIQFFNIQATGTLRISEATALANCDSWNSDFNRKQIPGIRRTITTAFKPQLNQQAA